MITRMAQTLPVQEAVDWQTELANAVSDLPELLALLDLDRAQLQVSAAAMAGFRLRVPRSFVAKMRPGDPDDPLLLQVLPQTAELLDMPGFTADPLQEAAATATSGLLHKYQSRALLTLSGACAVNCRYCFRRHFPYQDHHISSDQLVNVISYLQEHPQINEVILSGGDPLVLSNRRLEQVVAALEPIRHIKRLRIHSRVPVMIPQRIDDALLALLSKPRFQWLLVVHSNHAAELDDRFRQAMARLRACDVHLLNQSVLLKGVNDSAEVLAELSETLFAMRVLPYYLHLLDPVAGAGHFQLEQAQAGAIYQQLLALLPGYLVPRLVRELPGQPSKTPLI